MHAWRRLASLGCLLASVACGSETVVHNIDEREANKVIELLAENEIAATKGMVDTGRVVNFSITVPSKNRVDAIKLLNRHEMPRRADSGYIEIFKDSGLIPTSAEEKAKTLAALEGEIEKQLRLVDGILDVQVNLVQPEESALRTISEARSPTTASVTIKYLPASGGAKPLSEPQVQAIVAAGVERLTPDNVVVVMTPAGLLSRGERAEMAEAARGGSAMPMGPAMGGVSAKNIRMIILGLFGVVVALALILIINQMRLRTARNRLLRLQNEIARARRKPSEVSSAGGPPPMP